MSLRLRWQRACSQWPGTRSNCHRRGLSRAIDAPTETRSGRQRARDVDNHSGTPMSSTLLSQRRLQQATEAVSVVEFFAALREHLSMERELEIALNDALHASTPQLP